MAERMNGKVPYSRRTRGSERRGVKPTPDLNIEYRQRQSRQDRERLTTIFNQYRERIPHPVEDLGLGNPDLPAMQHKLELISNIEAYKATIVGGETGSGKSTQLPQYLYEAGYDLTIMLVPRRVIANGLGDRIREELTDQIEDFNAEETVGIVHGERVERHENNKIMVMTPNTFIKMEKELREKYGDKKVAIVADEIHEANLFTEIAVGVAATSVQSHDDWRLVAASATHNADRLQAPFQKLNGGFVPTVEIKGRPFQVELREQPELNPMQAYARNTEDHQKTMIFTSGKKEIEYAINETRSELEKNEKGSSNNVIFRKLHGELTEVEIAHINDPVPEGYRLVIVSSPAGMSGITIPGVTYVLTDGTINRSELDDDNAPGLKRYYLSRAGITQQIGRAGRDIPGGVGELCAPVHTKRIKSASDVAKGQRSKKTNQHDEPTSKGMPYLPFEERDEHEPPEIYSTILSRVVLSVATLGYSFYELNEYIPNRVKKINIINAEEVLTRLGALDDDGLVTETGKLMDRFPVTPELSRGLVEASRRNRSLQHMVRAALSASAISVGGIEDHRANEDAVKMRKQIIRRTTEDDLIAQLDLMEKLYERTDEEHDGYGFIERHGLHPKRVELAQKMTRKILSAMGIKPQNIVVTAPVPDEEQLLREDFSTGFIDYVYEDVGLVPRSKKISYRNIHGNSESTTRTISDRSVMKPSRGQLVAGIPRWYEKGERKDGTPIKHDIIDHVFKVEADVIGRVALKNGLIQDVWKESRMEGDQVVDYRQGTFGSIFVGSLEKRASSEHISEASQEVLVQYVLNNKGRVQQALRGLAEELEGYRNRIPPEVLSQLRKPNAPEDVTQNGITEMIRAAVRTTASAHGVEDWLARYAYSANITLEKYYDTENIVKLNEMSPVHITLGGENLPLWYENGYPYVTNVMKRHLLRVTNPVYLADGREVLYQRRASGSGRTERVSFGAPREV